MSEDDLTINTMVTTYDIETGKRTGIDPAQWHVIPPDTRDGKCPECAAKHEPHEPHNAQSLAYQYQFYAKNARWPTWADAIAHCSEEMQEAWKAALKEEGAWTEPS